MDFTLGVFVLIAGIFSLAVIHFLVLVLVLEPVINLGFPPFWWFSRRFGADRLGRI